MALLDKPAVAPASAWQVNAVVRPARRRYNMATWQFERMDPPSEPRARELWLQHAAGFIVFEDIRRYAMERIESSLSAEAVAAAKKGIDDAVYGLMMVIDGVSGGISNANYNVFIDFVVRLAKRKELIDDGLLSEVDLRQGDGMCMGYHGWLEGDFGKQPVAIARPSEDGA
jgi:hypothetical protein